MRLSHAPEHVYSSQPHSLFIKWWSSWAHIIPMASPLTQCEAQLRLLLYRGLWEWPGICSPSILSTTWPKGSPQYGLCRLSFMWHCSCEHLVQHYTAVTCTQWFSCMQFEWCERKLLSFLRSGQPPTWEINPSLFELIDWDWVCVCVCLQETRDGLYTVQSSKAGILWTVGCNKFEGDRY